ncbi:probable mitochondrial glutathione transporter SLC25A40 isoform X1 [Eriocheir sinensis]|uniref:probable mitochondrial glutathione transporter SLC25A40 isoform X1 n=2 Tax=Eriocheir sinensis TaxID=95602 RepID=UPI0021C7AFE7|nr:probable mitochondrial glutathione transporter SLC25A40 isoform X1 [Eriocheir sinensis]
MTEKASPAAMSDLQPVQQMVSSCTGALITSVFMTPFDVVKVRLQAQQRAELASKCFLYCNGLMDHICRCAETLSVHTQGNAWYNRPVPVHLNGTLDAFVKISRQEGMQSLWSGLSPTLVVALPNTVIYFTSYEQLRTVLNRYLLLDSTEPSSLIGGAAGGLARVWSVTLVSPFELVRTKMQATTMTYKELAMVMRREVSTGGVRSLWRGWVPTVLRDVPFSILYWLSYEKQKILMNQQCPSFQFTLIAGAVSGGIAGTLTLPLDVIKTHRQIEIGEELFSDSTKASRSTWEMLQHIYRQQGVRGLFSGLVPRLAKVMPACAIMISTYEYAKKFFRNRGQHIIEKSSLPLPQAQTVS